MPLVQQIAYASPAYNEMVALRDLLLRKPLKLHFTPEYLAQEAEDILIGCYEEDQLIGCCILSPVDGQLLHLRQMAVRQDWQYKGIGKLVIDFAEKEALQSGFSSMMMHARKVAVPFYEKCGYQKVGDEFLEVGIPHFEMRKQL